MTEPPSQTRSDARNGSKPARIGGGIAPAFLKRRTLVMPTLWGWLVLVSLAVGSLIVIGRGLHDYLALNDPVGEGVLVVEGWLEPEELDQAIAIFRSGDYDLLVTTGGPIESWYLGSRYPSYADAAAEYLEEHGLSNGEVIAVPAPRSKRDRTYASAVTVRQWGEARGLQLRRVDVVSAGVHARRSRLLYGMAFDRAISVGVLATRSADYDAARWWSTSMGTKLVLTETIAFLWTKCCFRPSASVGTK